MDLCVQVTCLACDHRSNTVEPFWDLSLEFPERYHCNNRESAAQASCHLTEMLAKFTETEALEGNIYACDHCNCECKIPPMYLKVIVPRSLSEVLCSVNKRRGNIVQFFCGELCKRFPVRSDCCHEVVALKGSNLDFDQDRLQ